MDVEATAQPDRPSHRPLRRFAFASIATALLIAWLGPSLDWLALRPGGSPFVQHVRPVLIGLLLVTGLIAIVAPGAAAALAAFTAAGVGVFAVRQLTGWSTALLLTPVIVAAVLWAVITATGRSRSRVVALAATIVVVTAAGTVVAGRVLDHFYGTVVPVSAAEELPRSAVRWIWSGAVTPSSFDVRARVDDGGAGTVRLVVTSSDGGPDRFVEPSGRDRDLFRFEVDGLLADTGYEYAVEVDGELDDVRTGSVRTFPTGPASFRFTLGACARTGSNAATFDAIAAEEPLFHLITGDFHYGDVAVNDRTLFDDVIDLTLRQPGQAALYRSVPIAYVWDDHDYGPNDADARSPSRDAAMAAYRANVPSYPLASDSSAVYQRFDVGRVRFLMTDARSARIPGETMLGEEQLAWLLAELELAAREAALVVWVNPVPWIAPARPGADDWGGFADERARIADAIAANGIDNLLMLSGDAHMVAIDDGTNTDYSSDGSGVGFPLLHAGPLDRPPSIKGGPYSEGLVAESGQFGRVDVTDDGESITVELTALRYDTTTLLSHTFEIDAPVTAGAG